MVGVGFGEGDFAGGGDDEGGGDGEAPGVGALIAVDEGDVDQDGAVVVLHGFGDGVGDAEGVGEDGAGVGEEGEAEVVVLDGEVVLAGELGRDGDEERAAFADGGEGLLPGFELGHAVGAPAAAEEEDDERADGEEVGGVDEAALAAVSLVRVVAAASGRSKVGAVAPTGRMRSSMPVEKRSWTASSVMARRWAGRGRGSGW